MEHRCSHGGNSLSLCVGLLERSEIEKHESGKHVMCRVNPISEDLEIVTMRGTSIAAGFPQPIGDGKAKYVTKIIHHKVKKQNTKLLAITSPCIDSFSKLFHCYMHVHSL